MSWFASVWKAVWGKWRRETFLFNFLTGHEKSSTWQCSQTVPPSKNRECKTHYIQQEWSKLQNYQGDRQFVPTHCPALCKLHDGKREMLQVNVCWHPLFIPPISSLNKAFRAIGFASTESSSCHVLSPTVWPTVWGQHDVYWAHGHCWSHSLDLCLFWELWLPLTSG